MSTKSGSITSLELPIMSQDIEMSAELNFYLQSVMFAIQTWASELTAKVEEIETISVNGQGLNLTLWAANAKIEKRDGVCVLFDGEPNVGTPGVGVQGWYLWSSALALWVKM